MRSAIPTLLLVLVLGCSGGGDGGTVEDCDAECVDRTALRGVRETLKLVYNLTLQGKPVGPQDEITPCPTGGGARVSGTATSSATQGTTSVDLVYELLECGYTQRDESPEENYALTLTGRFEQTGTIAVQPATNTALLIDGEASTLAGSVYDPQIPFDETGCAIDMAQVGDRLTATLCGRETFIDDL